MRKKLLSKFMLLLTMMFVGVGTAWADEESVDFTKQNYANQQAVESYSGTNFSIAFAKGSNSNAPKYYTSGTAIRAYGGNTMTVTSTNIITKIVLSFGSGDGSNAITTNVDTYSNGTWTGSATSVIFTVGGTSGNRRIQGVTVTYSTGGVNKQNAGLVYETTEYTVAPNADFTAPTLTNPNNLAVTYSSDNENVAVVDENTGEVLVGDEWGKATITATFAGDDTYYEGSASYTITVLDATKGTQNNPYTVAEAYKAIKAGVGMTGVYATGIVSEIVEEYSSQYHNISYNISDDGTTTANQLQAYRGKSYNGENFTSVNDIKVGDVVVVHGNLTTYGETYEFAQGNQLVSLIREKVDATIDVADATVAYGSNYTLDISNFESGDVTLSVENASVASVNDLVITPKAVGKTVVTVTTAENDYYKAGNATFTLTVTAPEGETKALVGKDAEILFNETFDKCDGTGGRDNTFTGSVGTSATTGKLDEEWDVIGNNGAKECIKLGTGSSVGTVTTSEISLKGSGKLTFSAAGWGTGTNTVSVSATGATLSGTTEFTMTNGEWSTYTVNITEATGNVNVTFSIKRGFLDDVKVESNASEAEPIEVTLNAKGYATFASAYPLDFSDDSEFSAWALTDISGSELTFDQITADVKGGTGVLLKGEAGATVTITSKDSETEIAANMLEGTLAPTYVADGEYYGLSGEAFVPVTAGTVKAGKALLATEWVELGAGVKAFTFVFNGADGVQRVETVSAEEAAMIFDLNGRRLSRMQKGVNIVNGKKVLVK